MSPLKHSKGFAARVGQWSADHWKTAVSLWLVFVVVSLFAGVTIGTKTISKTDSHVGESHTADRIISDAGFTVGKQGESIEKQTEMVLLQSKTMTADDPAFRAAIADAVKTVGAFPQVSEIRSPLDPGQDGLISKDGHSALVQFTPEGSYDEAILYIDRIADAVDKSETRHAGLTIQPVGISTEKELDAVIQGGLAKVGLISIPLTILVLLLVLGSLTAAMVPLLVALTSIIATSGLVALSSQFIPADQDIMEVILLVGLAVGVDYSLFYIRREREERAAGRRERAALTAAAATSGRAILVSGITVMIAMAGMFLSGNKTFMSFSVGTMLVVLVAMLGSLTVLPAVLSKLGDRIEKGRIPFVKRFRRPARADGMWSAILDRVLRRPLVSALAATAVLLTLAVPALTLRTAETGIDGISTPVVQPFVAVMDAFPGTPEPALVAIKADDVEAAPVRAAIADLQRKALATGEMHAPIVVETNPDRTVARVEIPLAGNGTDDASTSALATLRKDVLPETVGRVDGVEYAVTGATANSQDFNQGLSRSMPLVFGFVLLFAFGLLLVSFRSIVIAVKAIVLNLLSVAAAYGVIVAFFQWGWGEGLLDFHSNGGIANWLPMFMFVILFGLSMDYHVFILSRIREAYDRGLSTDKAITHGIKSTAATVTSAAIVMVGVFAVFAVLPYVDFKEMGLGLAVAVLIDATIVRAVLLPASMKLLGERNWYLPSWLRWLPRLDHGTSSEPIELPAAIEPAV